MDERLLDELGTPQQAVSVEQAVAGVAPQIVTVRMSQISVVARGETIQTLLGSCIGVAIYDLRGGIGGLAHVVLPQSRGHSGPPGKYVDTALPELIHQIGQRGGNPLNLRAKLAGGARMLATAAELAIGEQNLAAVLKELERRHIPVLGRHCGGERGRRMLFTPGTGRVQIDIVGCDSVEI